MIMINSDQLWITLDHHFGIHWRGLTPSQKALIMSDVERAYITEEQFTCAEYARRLGRPQNIEGYARCLEIQQNRNKGDRPT